MGWALPVCLVLASIVSQLISARSRTGPVWSDDEIGYLSNALVMSGYGSTPSLSFYSYYPGWSVVLVPLWWILQDPGRVYRAALLLSALSAVATIPVYACIARRFGLTWRNAVSAGAIVTLLPAITALSGFALAENFLGLMVALTAWSALRAWQTLSVRAFVLLGALASYTFFTHGRLVMFVAAAVLAGVALLIQKRTRQGLALIISTILLSGAFYEFYRLIATRLYPGAASRETIGIQGVLNQSPSDFVIATSGQLWYHVAASVGLVVLGVVFLVLRARDEWRAKSFGGATWILAASCFMCVFATVLIASSVSEQPLRLDTFIYGRYSQPVVSVFTLLGIVGALSAMPTRIRRPALLASIFGMAAYAVLALHVLPDLTKGGIWVPLNVPGITQFDWPGLTRATTAPIVPATIAGAVGCLFLIRPRASSTVLIVLGAYFTVSSAISEQQTFYPTYKSFENGFVLQKTIDEYPHDSVAFDTEGASWNAPSRNIYQFLLQPRRVVVVDTDTTRVVPDTDLVIARRSWPLGQAAGAKLIASDTFQDNGLWLMPKAQK